MTPPQGARIPLLGKGRLRRQLDGRHASHIAAVAGAELGRYDHLPFPACNISITRGVVEAQEFPAT